MKKKTKTFNYAKYGYLFSIPFVIAYLIFSLYPTIYTAIIGFTDLKGIGNTEIHFLEEPFKNFVTILTNPSFLTSLKNTVFLWVCNFIPQITLALLLAAWYTSRRFKIRGQGFFKVIFYLPNIITAATVAILFKALFEYPMSPMNDIVTTLGLNGGEPYQFLIHSGWARAVIIFIQFWMWYGYTMIILMSAILGISPDIFEAAEIDGANNSQTFFMITLPSIKTILTFTLITSLIGGLNMFDIPNLFLSGGPDNSTLTASVFIYNQAFSGSYMYNRASAASMIMFIIIAICSVFVFFMMRDKDEAQLRKQIKAQEKAYKAKMKAEKAGKGAE